MRIGDPDKGLSPRQIWDAALGSLQLQVSRPSYMTWLKDTSGLSFDGSKFVVGVLSPFVAQWLERRLSSLIEATLSRVVGHSTVVGFDVITDQPSPVAMPPGFQKVEAGPRHSPTEQTRSNGAHSVRLNPKYTLDSFVVGESNQLAYAAAKAISSRPGGVYNPLFLYGGVGLGKTHLLHGIGHAYAMQGLSYLYVSSEQFTNEFITSIQTKRTRDFREKYRSVDVLLMDDIQFMRGKEAIQEGFFHTFNDLHNANRQIVIACDRPSSALVPLENRLKSRFQWGLAADIRLPDHETRLAILRLKADFLGLAMPTDVLEMIAHAFRSSIRELEGALNRVSAYADITSQPICLDLAYQSLGDLLTSAQRPLPNADAIMTEVCSFFQISQQALASKRRDKHITLARQVAIYLLREVGHTTLKDIGLMLGGRDHSTIRHASMKIASEIPLDVDLESIILSIRSRITTDDIPN